MLASTQAFWAHSVMDPALRLGHLFQQHIGKVDLAHILVGCEREALRDDFATVVSESRHHIVADGSPVFREVIFFRGAGGFVSHRVHGIHVFGDVLQGYVCGLWWAVFKGLPGLGCWVWSGG